MSGKQPAMEKVGDGKKPFPVIGKDGKAKRPEESVYVTWEDICVCCGAPVPEGRMVCWQCEHQYDRDEMAAFRPRREESMQDPDYDLDPPGSRKKKRVSLQEWLARTSRRRGKGQKKPGTGS